MRRLDDTAHLIPLLMNCARCAPDVDRFNDVLMISPPAVHPCRRLSTASPNSSADHMRASCPKMSDASNDVHADE